MDKNILVAYATKYAATGEIAEKIGEVLRQSGLETEVIPAQRVRDLSPYRTVILGSAAYMFHWRKEAVQFLNRHEKALSGLSLQQLHRRFHVCGKTHPAALFNGDVAIGRTVEGLEGGPPALADQDQRAG
jgi:hypothetical protein